MQKKKEEKTQMEARERIIHPIPPFYRPDSRILILGSFPSVKSRECGFFYGHKRNRFWKVLSSVLGSDEPVTVEEKKAFLAREHIALWDSLESCEIHASSDSSIRKARPNDLSVILEAADIRQIFCNGEKAYSYYDRMIRPVTGRKAVRLPSTSPANAAWSADRLVRAWDAVREPLGVLPAECGQVLLSWYDRNRRILPWREAPSAYHVWISEIMLQQTRVEAVKKYYDRWIRRLPDPAALAAVEDEELMKLWEGLGYYNRVRNLKKAAISVMEDWGGALPGDYENLKSLPGIGDYTAGAIASIAFGIRVPAVDGNAIRIVSRMLAEEREIDRESVKREIRERIFRIMPKERPGDFNQALMDLGASVCLPGGRPLCESCPWESKCISARRGSQDKYPVRKKKKERKKEDLTVFLIIIKDRVCLHKRPSTGLLADMWEFPNLAGDCPPDAAADYADKVLGLSDYSLESAGKGKHVFTHVEWQMRGYRIRADHLPERVIREKDLVLVTEEELQSTYAVPSAFETFKKELLDKEPAGSGQT